VSAARTVSLRWSLLRGFLVVVLISSLTFFAMMQYRALETERALSLELTQRGHALARDALDRFLEPARSGAVISGYWGALGLLELGPLVAGPAGRLEVAQREAIRQLNRLFLPIMKSRPLVSSIAIGNARGEGWLLMRLPEGQVRNRIVARGAWGDQALWLDVDFDGTPANPAWETSEYDPRQRPWYTGAEGLQPGQLHWTEPYTFFTTKEPGITASSAWTHAGSRSVIAWDITLTALSDFTQDEGSKVSKRSLVAVFDAQRRYLGLPHDPRYRDPEAVRADLLKPLDGIANQTIHAAVEAALASGAGPAAAGRTLAFESGGEKWWAVSRPYTLHPGRDLFVAVLVPSADLVGQITQLRIGLLLSTLAAVVAALVFALFMTRAYSRPLEALAAQSRRLRALDFSAEEPVEANVREVRELAEAQAQAQAAVESFSRYVPVEVVRELVAEGDVARIGGQSREMTLLFSDIAGFTRISEGMEPQALADHMAGYFDALIDLIQANNGTVDKLVGDAIVAFWGAPLADAEHAVHATAAALACRERLQQLNATWAAEGAPVLETRFGLASGTVIVGNFGAPDRLAYTVLGDRVNLASRLEGLNKLYGTAVLVDEATVAACGTHYAWRRLDRVVVKGHNEPTWIHELLGAQDAVDAGTLARARAYEAAWERYAAREFDAALDALDALLAEAPDTAAQRLRARCAALAARAPGQEWEAVYRAETK